MTSEEGQAWKLGTGCDVHVTLMNHGKFVMCLLDSAEAEPLLAELNAAARDREMLAARVRELEAAMFDIERILNRRNAAYAKYAHAITLKQLGKVALLSQGAAE